MLIISDVLWLAFFVRGHTRLPPVVSVSMQLGNGLFGDALSNRMGIVARPVPVTCWLEDCNTVDVPD
jgi:hypothetical protein